MAENKADLSSYCWGCEKCDVSLTGWKSTCWQGCIGFGGCEGEFCFLAFYGLQRLLAFLSSCPPSSIFKASNGLSPFNSICTIFFTSLFHFSGPLWLNWVPLDNPGQSPWLSWWATLLPSASVILNTSCNVIYSQVPGLERDHSSACLIPLQLFLTSQTEMADAQYSLPWVGDLPIWATSWIPVGSTIFMALLWPHG